jgi:hypothetical protein
MVATLLAVLASGCQGVVGGGAATPTGDTALPNVCAPNPDPAGPDLLLIDLPRPGDAVKSPIKVSGRIAAFEATFLTAVFDASGKPIARVVGMSLEGQTLSPFSVEVPFAPAQGGLACLWVYQESARDGRPITVGQVPILLTAR